MQLNKILIIDDDLYPLHGHVALLESAGYRVETAASGEEGLETARRNKPDLVLLDIVLPDADGRDIGRRLKQDPDLGDLYLVLLSAVKTDPESLAEGFETGADDFLKKPISKEELLVRVRAIFRMKQSEVDRKKAEEDRDKMAARLHQAQKLEAVGRLAGGVAHDFNNMLSIIIGHAELILDEIGPADPFHLQITEMKAAALRSADLTRQLLAFARKQLISPRILDLNDTASSILKMLLRLIGEDIDLAWIPGSGIWPVKMDPSQIDQIMANLAINARDAIAGVGTLTIETANVVFDEAYCHDHEGFSPGGYVMIAVSDTGSGMDQSTRDRIFEPFFTTKEVGKGTGLGLATVYGIVRQNNGFIHVYSEPGQGTTFRIYLPRAEVPAIQEMPEPSRKRALSGTETVLLVEDEPSILGFGKTVLERRGYTVLAAQNPEAALKTAESHSGPIHLLITDVVMPLMNGKELKKRLETIRPGLKCIFMSGYTANAIAHRGVIEEGMDFLQKPFSVTALAEKVRDVLNA